MFEKDYSLSGKHATYAKYLKDDAKLYETIVDVYMNGAIFGLLFNRVSPKDNTSSDKVTIFADAFSRRRDNCVFLYRLAMLLDKTREIDNDERLDRAFRDDADESTTERLNENLDLFNAYVRGGIEVMYERFIVGGHTPEDYLDKAIEFMEEFSEDLSDEAVDSKIAELIR